MPTELVQTLTVTLHTHRMQKAYTQVINESLPSTLTDTAL